MRPSLCSWLKRISNIKHHLNWPSDIRIIIIKSWATFNDIFCQQLTHWGRVTHICVSKLTIIGADNGLSPGRRQAIIWTNAGILLTGPLGTNVNEISIEIHAFSFKEFHLKMSSGKCRPFCLGLSVLTRLKSCPKEWLISFILNLHCLHMISMFTNCEIQLDHWWQEPAFYKASDLRVSYLWLWYETLQNRAQGNLTRWWSNMYRSVQVWNCILPQNI